MRDEEVEVKGKFLNPMGFLDSYRTNDPLLMGQSSATLDYLNGLFG
jgi:hypothetical protein